MKSLKKIGSTDVSKDKLPQCEKVDELSTTEKAEPHTEADNATKDANEFLQNYIISDSSSGQKPPSLDLHLGQKVEIKFNMRVLMFLDLRSGHPMQESYLPAKALGPCELGHSVTVKIYVKICHLANLVSHCLLCTVHLPEE